tara:strand:- start:141 stop:527 length:387 start_codon:yes stop_codon:yes gene_type:complete
MKIIGIGVDMIQNSRISSSIKNIRFIKRTFSKNEINISKKLKNKTNFFSKRFVAKEAFAKALGTGIRNDLNFKDIQILNDKFGKPYYMISTKIKSMIRKKKRIKNFDIFLSISDQKEYSIAFAIIQTI